jgi:hypothetical protein
MKYFAHVSCYSDLAKGWTTEELGFDSLQWQKVFLFSIKSRPALDPTQISIQFVSPREVKQQERESDS